VPELRTSATRAVWSPPARTTTHPKNRDANDQSRRARELLSGTRCARIDASSASRTLRSLSSAAMAAWRTRRVRPENRSHDRPYVNVSDSHAQSSVTMVTRRNRSLPIALSQRGEVVRFSHETSVFRPFPCSRRVLAFRSKPPDLPAYFAVRALLVRRGKAPNEPP